MIAHCPFCAPPEIRQSTEVQLSRRDAKIVKLIADGKTNSQIAEILELSKKTVEKDRAELYRKTGVESTAGVVHLALYLALSEPMIFPHVVYKP